MQRVVVQCSGSRFPSSVPRVSPLDGCSICVCRQGFYHEAPIPPVTDTVHATKQRCRGSLRHYISRVLQSPLPCPKEVRRLETRHRPLISQLLPRDSPLHDGECGKHSTISPSRRLGHFHRSCGCLFPHTHPYRLPKMSSISDSGHHIPIPGTTVWPFSSTLGIHQDYDRDQNAGTRDGHQSLSVPGRLAHLFTISRPVPPRHCTSAQSLPHDGSLHSRHEVGTDTKTEIPFQGYQFDLVSFQVTPTLDRYYKIKALIRSFLLSQGGCAHTWQILLGLFASTEKLVPLGRLHTREAQHYISQHWDFDALTSYLWIPLSPRRRKISNGESQHTVF